MPKTLAKPSRLTRINRAHPFASWVEGAWLFNEGQGTRAASVIAGTHGTIANPAWVRRAGTKYGMSLDINLPASGTAVTVGSYTGTEWTMAFRANVDSFDVNLYRYIWGRTNAIAYGFARSALAPNGIGGEWGCWLSDGSFTFYGSGWVPTVGVTVYDFIMSRDSAGTMRFWSGPANGVLTQRTTRTSTKTPQSNANASTIGAFSGGENFDGSVYHFIRLNRAITTMGEARKLAGRNVYDLFQPALRLVVSNSVASAAITGTATASITESDVVAGGKTIIITLTGDTFKAAGTGPIGTTAESEALLAGIDSAQAEATGWDAEVKANLTTSDLVRTSDTVATITLPAAAAYDITAQETITVTVPTDVLVTGASAIVASPTFTVDSIAASMALPLLALRQNTLLRM